MDKIKEFVIFNSNLTANELCEIMNYLPENIQEGMINFIIGNKVEDTLRKEIVSPDVTFIIDEINPITMEVNYIQKRLIKRFYKDEDEYSTAVENNNMYDGSAEADDFHTYYKEWTCTAKSSCSFEDWKWKTEYYKN